jgi:arsenate reductase
MKTVVFACVENAGRSQMAAAFFNEAAPPEVRAVSAGTRPAPGVHPEVVDAMREAGVELTERPRVLSPAVLDGAQLLVTMGCGEDCPFVPGLRREDWSLPDPKGQPPAVVRAIRDDIRSRVHELVTGRRWEYDPQTAPAGREAHSPAAPARVQPADLRTVGAFLEGMSLDPAGLEDPNVRVFAVGDASGILGSVAIELEDGVALLRSLAVRAEYRGRGLGETLLEHALAEARRAGASEAYLLTETAAPFFAARGWTPVRRDVVDSQFPHSEQVRHVCPSTAAAMRRDLQ